MKYIKSIHLMQLFAAVLTVCIILPGCRKGEAGDSSRENEIAGTWEMTESVDIHGESIKMRETISFSLGGGRDVKSSQTFYKTGDKETRLGTFSYSGRWSSTSESVEIKVNPKTLVFSFPPGVSAAVQTELQNMVLKNLGRSDDILRGEIVDISESRLILKGEGEGMKTRVYERVNPLAEELAEEASVEKVEKSVSAANVEVKKSPSTPKPESSSTGLRVGHHSISGYATDNKGNRYPFSIEFNYDGETVKNAKYHNPNYGAHCSLPTARLSGGEFYFSGKTGSQTLIISFSARSPYSGYMTQGSSTLPVYMNL